ncbi:MAG: endonuclease/exonuclease/phosphatase family protein [Ferruginibacter sp.]|nr:endonuclease/exonuclease/phosphatase family protein [Ferruginibacter sp.]
MTKLMANTFKIVNVLLAGIYLLACLIPTLPTGKFWMIAMLGLGFPILFFMVLAFMLGWLIMRSKWFLVSLAAILISWKQVSVVFAFHPTNNYTAAKPNSTLRVLTWNVSSWGETNKSRHFTPNFQVDMRAFVKQQNADVLCLQEFYDTVYKNKDVSVLKMFREAGYKYSYFEQTVLGDMVHKTGVAILSKYPIINKEKFVYGLDDFAEHLIYADIAYEDKVIRVITTHLQSVRFDTQEYTSLRKIKHTEDPSLKESRNIVSKLKHGYQFRGAQANLVNDKIRSSPYPVIVCGDFNDVPNSYTYFKIRGDLQDAFLEKGNRLGRTFRYISPTLRIDYILADKKFEVQQFERFVVPYSDHYPILADFKL